jgi:hypothetical protein
MKNSIRFGSLNMAIEVILEELKTQEVKLPPIPPFPKK